MGHDYNITCGELNNNNINTIQIVANYSNKIITTYLNGSKISDTQYNSNLINKISAPIYIGKRFKDNDSFFDGNIYAVRIYDRVLNNSEIQNNYNWDNYFFSK